jgi:hypothetical protein
MADKLKIAKHFILSSPYGQLKDVIAGSFFVPSNRVPPHFAETICFACRRASERAIRSSLFTHASQTPVLVLDFPSVL